MHSKIYMYLPCVFIMCVYIYDYDEFTITWRRAGGRRGVWESDLRGFRGRGEGYVWWHRGKKWSLFSMNHNSKCPQTWLIICWYSSGRMERRENFGKICRKQNHQDLEDSMIQWREHSLWDHTWPCSPALPLTSCVTLGNLLKLLEPPFPHLKNVCNNTTYLICLLGILESSLDSTDYPFPVIPSHHLFQLLFPADKHAHTSPILY